MKLLLITLRSEQLMRKLFSWIDRMSDKQKMYLLFFVIGILFLFTEVYDAGWTAKQNMEFNHQVETIERNHR